jgi:hypothetical protein
MNCERNACNQGRIPCVSPWVCGGHSLHRHVYPIVEFGPAEPAKETQTEEASARLLPAWVAWVGVAIVLAGLALASPAFV